MIDVERAVERLTTAHVEMIDGIAAQCEPLLVMLREARYPNLGRTRGGGGNGDVLDMQAITMYENIDGIVRSWINHYRVRAEPELTDAVRQLHDIINTEYAGDRLEDPDRMFGMFGIWVQQIEDRFDPPHEYEITVPCPAIVADSGEKCGAERIPIGDEPEPGKPDDRPHKWAVRVQVKTGRALVAECFSCEAIWVGDKALGELAEAMGVVVDWVAARTAFDTPA